MHDPQEATAATAPGTVQMQLAFIAAACVAGRAHNSPSVRSWQVVLFTAGLLVVVASSVICKQPGHVRTSFFGRISTLCTLPMVLVRASPRTKVERSNEASGPQRRRRSKGREDAAM